MSFYKKQVKVRYNTEENEEQLNLSSYGNLQGGYGQKLWAKKDIEAFKKEIMAINGFQGFIIDLRNNPGGFLDSAISAVSKFVDKGLATKLVGPKGKKKSFKTFGNSFPDFPIAVLINDHTASAAELFAAVIRDRKAGVLVGRDSWGKSVVQNYFSLPNGFWLKLTTSQSLTPSGDKIPNNGIKPDLESPQYFKDKEIALRWLQTQ